MGLGSGLELGLGLGLGSGSGLAELPANPNPNPNPSRQLPLLLRRKLGAAESAPPEAGASGGKGSAADNGKRLGDLLPACIEALFAQQPAAGTSGASPDSCAAAQ